MEIFGADYLEISVLVYWGTVLVCLLLETRVPARKLEGSLRRRWAGNWSLGILSILLPRILLGSLTGTTAAFWAREVGFGLFNIRERLEHIGGHVEIRSRPGKGTRVILRAPMTRAEQGPEREP